MGLELTINHYQPIDVEDISEKLASHFNDQGVTLDIARPLVERLAEEAKITTYIRSIATRVLDDQLRSKR